MTTTNSVDDPFRATFESVIQDFRAKLKNDALYSEILQTKNIEEVYNFTDRLQEEQARTGKLRHMSKIFPFLEGLRGYASVIEVFMQAKPDILALVWGPIKLLLQWADVLKQSMDAIIDTIHEIGTRLPEFRTSTRLFGENKLILDVLVFFFRDLMDFYIIALKFFNLPRLKLVFEALWPRQRDKIKIVISNIERHTLLLRNEVRLEHIQAEYDFRQQALEHFEKSEVAHLRQEYYSLRTSISPRTYQETLAYLDDRSCHEAGQWLVKHDRFCNWLDTTTNDTLVLWLRGIPGSGKTYLARIAVHEARKRGHSLFAFLSYTFSSSISILSILHSLIFQLTTDDSNLQSIVCYSSGEEFRRNVDVAQAVFRALVDSAGPVYVFVDGLDEIDGPTRCGILRILLELSKEVDTLRVMISSRPEADITSLLSERCSSIRVNEQNSGGLQSYISQRTLNWYEDRGFYPEARKEMEILLAPLAAKSQGMFLYAKVVLDSIQFLEPDEIMADLKVLPGSLDDAYGRILKRINTMVSPIAKSRARTIIGWIGVSPVPLTIHELEQALAVRARGIGGTGKVSSRLSVEQICGPIVEVVDEYVQYVHFTVYEFFLSPQISNSIDPQESRSSLAACCITYLCQNHQDTTIDEEARSSLVLDGSYRFHYYSSSFWLKLLEDILSSGTGSFPKELVDLLTILYDTRGVNVREADEKPNENMVFDCLKRQNPTMYAKIGQTVSFQDKCSQSGFEYRKNQDWTKLDPLETSRTSCHIFGQIERLLLASAKDDKITQQLERHYGQRLYKCAYINCSFKRYGFESNILRKSHEQSHAKPWKCSFPDCEFNKGGFLSRKMRDDHLDHFHFQENIQSGDVALISDKEELTNLCFDLVKADDIAGLRALAMDHQIEDNATGENLRECAAKFGSPEIWPIVEALLGSRMLTYFRAKRIIRAAANNNNQRMWEYLMGLSGKEAEKRTNAHYCEQAKEDALAEVMRKGNDEMLEKMCRWVHHDILGGMKRAYLIAPDMIAATANDTYREQILLGLWKKVPKRFWTNHGWRNALPNVASTTCSAELAQFLLEQDFPVDSRASEICPTALLRATRKTTAAAANLAKILLFNGANTVVQMQVGIQRRDRKTKTVTKKLVDVQISKQKGAQNISQWLGVTWDELVAQADKARQHSADPNTNINVGPDGR